MAVARNVLSAEADAAMDEARRGGMSYEALAALMGYKSQAMVNKAISRHRRRMRGEVVEGS
jgi:hypothetical protein